MRFMAEGGSGGSGGGSGAGDGGSGAGEGGAASAAFDFAGFTAKLDEPTRTGLTAHLEASEKGLKSALQTEREQRSAIEKQLGDLKAKAEKGSELEKQLEGMQGSLKTMSMQTAFYEAAVGAGCADIALAWAAARMNEDKFFKRDGSPDIDALKLAHPSLFADAKKPNAQAGSGAGSGGGAGTPGKNDAINALIRGG